MDERRFDRQIRAFGEEGQQKLEKQRVGIVGLGGIGSQVSQALAHLGIRDFVLVDPDRVEWSNLNRLVGATPADAEESRSKVEVAGRLIRSVNPNACVTSHALDLRTAEALVQLKDRDVVFGAVDNDGARLVLTELTAAYRIVYIDSATDFPPDETGAIHFGGRVVVARPGHLCLLCAHEIDSEVAKIELEPPETRVVREEHGYGLGPAVPSPAVISLNAVVANAAVTEFICLVTGLREPFEGLHYLGDEAKLKPRSYSRDDSACYTCNRVAGIGDAAGILERYLTPKAGAA